MLVFAQMGVLGALVNAFETSVRCVIPDLVRRQAGAPRAVPMAT